MRGGVRARAASLVFGLFLFALGGTFGVGTVLFALGVGPCIEVSFWLLSNTPLVRVETSVVGSVGPTT